MSLFFTKGRAAVLLAALAGVLAFQPAWAAEHCRMKRVGSIPVSWQGMDPRIEGSINGTPVTMSVDTGAFDIIIGGRVAERLKLPLTHADFELLGVGGSEQAYGARVAEISFGTVRWKNADLVVSAGMYDAVLVGANFLFKRDLEWTGKELVFFESVDCDDAWLGYWGGEDIAVVPLRRIGPKNARMEVLVRINGQPVRAVIDSGTTQSSISLEAARRLGFDPSGARATEGGHGASVWQARFDTFELGGEVIRNPHLVVEDLWSSVRRDFNFMDTSAYIAEAPQMRLGADFLKAHRVLFAVSQQKMYFSYLGGDVFNAPAVAPAPTALPASSAASGPEPTRVGAR
jgi:predicted aspartyl protease